MRTTRTFAGLALLLGLALTAQPLLGQDVVPVAGVQIINGDQVQVVIQLDGTVTESSISTFSMPDPDRVMVDILDAVPGSVGGAIDGVGTLVSGVVISPLADSDITITRITISLTGPAEHSFRVEDGKIILTLTAGVAGASDDGLAGAGTSPLDTSRGVSEGVGTPSGPYQISGLSLSSLDFIDEDTRSRVIIAINSSVDYTTSQPQRDLVVVDIPGAAVPQSLERVLDTSHFISPVRMVRAYKTRDGARVAISLSRSVEWSVSEGDSGQLVLDFPLPADMQEDRSLASQSFSEAAPSDPQTSGGEGLKGAYASETLISASGRTHDPQAVFGSGRGAGAAGALGGLAGFSFDSGSASQGQWSGRRINLDLVEADIHAVFRLISHVSRLNIVSGDDVKGTVTVRLIDVPWDQALAVILQAKGLASQQFGNIVRVAPIETIKAEQQAAVEAQRAQYELTPLQVLVVPLNYAKAEEVAVQVSSQLSARGSVEIDARSNQIIVQDTEEKLAQIRELIRQVDRQTPQVLIEARIVEATSRFSRSLGIQWGGELDMSPNTGYGTGIFFPATIGAQGGASNEGNQTAQFYSPGQENLAVDLGAGAAPGSLALALGSVSGLINLDARLSAMESEGWGEVVSAPRITTLDNISATIKQGARIPYLSVSAGGTQVQFIQAALELKVTPHITSEGTIFMDLSIKNDRADFSNVVQGQPSIQIKEASTQLLVADGDTTVIGGVFSTEEGVSQDRIPFLGRIPVLGALFRNNSRNLLRNEMLVFVTPHIITAAER
jgi:type IV pilus assembly protein PilQ